MTVIKQISYSFSELNSVPFVIPFLQRGDVYSSLDFFPNEACLGRSILGAMNSV